MDGREENSFPNPNPNLMETSLESRNYGIIEDEHKLKRLKIELEERNENKAIHVHQILPTLITCAEASRVAKLKRILKVLKEIDTSLLNPSLLLLPTLDDQRIYKLISIHLSYCIFLFNIESCSQILQQQHHEEESPPISTTIPFPHIDDDNENQENLKDLEATEDNFPTQLCGLIDLLKECRLSIALPPNEEFTVLHPCCELRKHRLLGVLLDLEEMASSRGYAPPNHGREIGCYKEIQKLVAFFLTRIRAHIKYAQGIYPPGSPLWRNITGETPPDNTMSVCRPLGHMLATAFDLIPQTRSLLERYTRQLSSVFLNVIDGSDGYDGETYSGGADDIVDRAEQNPQAVVKSMIECLRIIGSKFELVGELRCGSVPTIKEIRLYAEIVAHVRSAIWLSDNMGMHVERVTGGVSHQVNVASVKDHSCTSLAVPDTTGDSTSIRERYLLEIVSYLHAIRSSCAIAIPTSEELECYKILSKNLDDSLFSVSLFSSSVPPENAIEETDKIKPPVISDEEISVLRHQLNSINRSKLKFLAKLNDLCASVIYMIGGSVTSNEQTEDLNVEAAMDWVTDNTEQLGDRLKEIFRKLPEGRIDRAIVFLEEIAVSIYDIDVMLSDAAESITFGLEEEKQYELVAAEVYNASLFITGKIKHLSFETV